MMKRKKMIGRLLLCMGLSMMASSVVAQQTITLRLLETTDVHGSYLPFDFTAQKNAKGSLAAVATYVKQLRKSEGKRVILMDNGDILQGQPIAYYYNYIDTMVPHVTAQMMNYLRYDIGVMGNHDVETGHRVYDRWIAECNFPVLGGNIIDKQSHNGRLLPTFRKALVGLDAGLTQKVTAQYRQSQAYLPPYRLLQRDGITIAIVGLITPAIPSWLPENLWHNLWFEDMEKTARAVMAELKRNYKPDVVVGVFHAGPEGNRLGDRIENGSRLVAENVPGFDVVFMGHDHRVWCEKTMNVAGDSVWIVGPANAARRLADVTIQVTKKGTKMVSKQVKAQIVDLTDIVPDADFVKTFEPQAEAVKRFVNRQIGRLDRTIRASDAFFGPSAFVDLIHRLQLQISGAQISFCAPLSSQAVLRQGAIRVSDMFNLYRFENMLYTMRLKGKEIKGFLEMSYALWTNRMRSPQDHLILMNERDEGFGRFLNPTFNFDSAAGIVYTVDVTKPEGEKIHIERMADGKPFDEEAWYTVAVNSYRGNGGGDLLTKGAGIAKEELARRIVSSTDKDLRYYLMQAIEEAHTLSPRPLDNWKFVPTDWASEAARRDRAVLFGKEE